MAKLMEILRKMDNTSWDGFEEVGSGSIKTIRKVKVHWRGKEEDWSSYMFNVVESHSDLYKKCSSLDWYANILKENCWAPPQNQE